METDREILIWFYQRLIYKYSEDELVDYMHRLRWIILAQNNKKISRGQKIKSVCNTTKDLAKLLKNPTEWEKVNLVIK